MILTFQFALINGQKSWGAWTNVGCFKGIQFRVNKDRYNEFAKKWEWSIQIKNNYNKKVSLSYKLTTPEDGEKKTNSRTTIEVGAIDSGDWSLLTTNRNQIQIYVDKVCFHHPNGFDQCSEYNNKDYAAFADCDNGTPNYTIWDGKKNSTISNSDNTNDIQELWKKQISVYKEIKSLEPNTKVEMYEGNITDPLDFRIQKIKENIKYLENYLEQLKTGVNEKIKQQEKEKKAKQQQYSSYIQQGDEAMGKEEYSNAMNSYQNAQNYASTDSERSSAQQKYNQAFEAKKSAERKERVADQKLTDDKENVAYAATSGAAITAMSLMEDSPSEGFTSGKFFLGLNIEQLPLISNNTSPYHTSKSYLETPLTPGFDFGLTLGIANNKNISVYLTPRFSYGLNALTTGTSGSSFEYGGTALIRGNWKKDFPLKIYAEGGYFKRNAVFHYDADASAASSGVSSSTDDVRDGEYNYSVLRYGGGIMFHQIDDEEEYVVKGGVFFDKPSFFPKETKPVIGFGLQGLYNKLGSLEIYYSPNYFIGGTLLYPSTLEKENKSYFGIKFTRTGKLW